MTDLAVLTQELTRHYRIGEGTVEALAGVDLGVRRGEFVAVAGVSGSGKSTLLHLVGGLERPTGGQVWVDGVELGSAGEAELTHHRRRRVGFVFQTFNLLPRLTTLENAALPLMFAGVPRREREAQARALLEQVGLGHRLDHYPTQLSGGEQQRVAIARALGHDPAVILADEPTGNLDTQTGAGILALLRRLNRERGVTVLLVTHDPAAAAVADRVIHLRDGRVERVEESEQRSKGARGQGGGGAEELRRSPLHPSTPAPRHTRLRLADLLRSAFANFSRRIVRSGLTVIGVFVGIITIVAMLSVAVGVEMEVQRNIEAMGMESVFVTPPHAETDGFAPYAETRPGASIVSPQHMEAGGFDSYADSRPEVPITPAAVETLRRMPEVASVAPLVDLPSYLDLSVKWGERAAPARVQSSTEQLGPFEGASQVLAGRQLDPGEARGVVLSARLARDLGVSDYGALVGQVVTLTVRLPRGETGEFPVTVLGVEEGRRSTIELGVEDAAEIKYWWYGQPDLLETRGYDGLVVKATSMAAVPAVEDQVKAMGFQARSLRTFLDLANRIFAVLNTLLGSVGGLALFVAALGVTNTMIMAVYERTREIGILKAIGASRGDVLRLFIVEAALIGFLGGVLGLALGTLLGRGVDWAAHWYLESEGVRGIGSLSVVPWWLALGALSFGTLVGLAAGVSPASRAARLDPVAALRYE